MFVLCRLDGLPLKTISRIGGLHAMLGLREYAFAAVPRDSLVCFPVCNSSNKFGASFETPSGRQLVNTHYIFWCFTFSWFCEMLFPSSVWYNFLYFLKFLACIDKTGRLHANDFLHEAKLVDNFSGWSACLGVQKEEQGFCGSNFDMAWWLHSPKRGKHKICVSLAVFLILCLMVYLYILTLCLMFLRRLTSEKSMT